MRSFRMRLVTFLLSVVFVFTLFPAHIALAYDESGKCGDNITWKMDFNTDTLIISGEGDMYDYFEDGAPWSEYALGHAVRTFTKVVFKGKITSIGSCAFMTANYLEDIEIPNTVTSIGYNAFFDCNSLRSITIPDSVTKIEHSVFWCCPKLKSVTLSKNIKNIPEHAFGICESLSDIKIPDNVTSIGDGAFSDCTSLESISIPAGVKTIDEYAFSDCTALKDVNYGGCSEKLWKNISIGKKNEPLLNAKIHYGKHKTEKVSGKAATCTEDGYKEYYKCSRCKDLFSDAKGEKEISKPVPIPKLGHQLNKLIYVPAKDPTYTKDGNIEYCICPRCKKLFRDSECKEEITKAQTIIPKINAAKLGDIVTVGNFTYQVTYPATDGTGTVMLIGVVRKTASVTIPNTINIKVSTYKVDRINGKAFYKNKKIKNLFIGSNVRTIDKNAFYGCKKLKTVSGGAGLETIGTKAFAKCKKLKKFKIVSPVLCKIGVRAFNKDKKLKTINIKKTIKLTKAGVKKSLKGSKVKTVKVKKSRVKKYKKFFKKSNSGRSVKVKK